MASTQGMQECLTRWVHNILYPCVCQFFLKCQMYIKLNYTIQVAIKYGWFAHLRSQIFKDGLYVDGVLHKVQMRPGIIVVYCNVLGVIIHYLLFVLAVPLLLICCLFVRVHRGKWLHM